MVITIYDTSANDSKSLTAGHKGCSKYYHIQKQSKCRKKSLRPIYQVLEKHMEKLIQSFDRTFR